MQAMKKKCLVVGVGFLFTVSQALAERPSLPQATESLPVALVDSAWLATRLRQPDVRLLEIGQRESYELGHLPQALFVDWVSDITNPAQAERYNALSREQMEQLLGRLGVSNQTTVVLYDKLGNRLATRMFWNLRHYGHQRIKILDGGANAWLMAGHAVVVDVPVVSRTSYRIRRIESDLSADLNFIRQQLSSPQLTLIDGRPIEQFTGEEPGKVYHTGREHARRGHIPQAVNIPWQENLTSAGTFKSVRELRKLYSDAGLTEASTIVTYCNEGLHAAHPWFVLTEVLGYRDVRLYDDSLAEWANTPDVPLETTANRSSTRTKR